MKYYFSPKISYKLFKLVNDKLYKGSGSDIQPKHMDKILWELLRDRKINILVDTKSDDPIHFSLKSIPKNSKIISNPSK